MYNLFGSSFKKVGNNEIWPFLLQVFLYISSGQLGVIIGPINRTLKSGELE